MTSKQKIKIAHSPDSDDAFMFYALKHGKITSEKYEFEIERRDIEELNQLAKDEVYDITAISMHAYAHLSDKYVLTKSGASMAEKDYGPMVIARNDSEICTNLDLINKKIAVPGLWTTACLVLRMMATNVEVMPMPFDQIMDAVSERKVDAGLIIHEGQLVYENMGFKKIAGLIDYWKGIAGNLPLPLGGSAVKKSLGDKVMSELSDLQAQSIAYAMQNPQEARDYALTFKRDLNAAQADQYLGWYANERTLDMGEEGKKAIELLFLTAYDSGLLRQKIEVEVL